jgi:PAS domain S-box-containing protein
MQREELLYIIPYLLSFALSLGVFLYSWQHRRVRGAGAYTWFVGGQTLAIFAFILELVSMDVETKIFWDKLQWFADINLIVVPFVVFAVQFTDMDLRRPTLFRAAILSIPLIFDLLLITDPLHHLIYPNPHLLKTGIFAELKYEFTGVIHVLALYIYGATVYGIGLLIRRILRPHNLYRSQLATIAIGFLIPVGLSIFALLGINLSPERDVFPFSSAVGNLIVAWGLFRFHLFKIVPIARERVFENMTDPVIVVDALGRVVDINQIALQKIQRSSSQVIGQPTHVVLAEWPELERKFRNAEAETAEVTARVQGEDLIYEINVSPIYDNRNRMTGRVFVAHDITRRKSLENGYRLLSQELEQRVQERTNELEESEERFAILAASTFEAVVLTEGESILDANEQMLTMFGYAREELIGMRVANFIAPESMSKVRQHRAAGAEEAYEHIAIKRDGTKFPVEVRPRSMPYKGHPVRVTAIRDITDRKHAEDELREAYDTTLEGWVQALELRDKETEGHSRRVTETTLKIARRMGFGEQQLVQIRRGAILHDIGKIGIPDEILRKPGALTDDERKIINEHPQTAYNLLYRIPHIKDALDIPYCHHEKWDGSGYPRGLRGEEIPLSARIFAVVDVWDALTADRPYRKAWPNDRVVEHLRSESGKYFDPQIVSLFLSMLDEGGI